MALVSGLERHLGYWMRLASNHVSVAFAAKLQLHDASTSEWVALRYLYDHAGVAPKELADFMGMTRGAISKVVDRLHTKDLVSVVTDPEDARGQMLSLSAKGSRLLPLLAQAADDNDSEFFDCLTEAERRNLRRILRKMAERHQWQDVPLA